MYNISKGGNTLKESEILEPLHTCLRELIDRDLNRKGDLIKYTDDDVVAATLLYSHILGNRLVHTLTDERVSIGMAQELARNYSNEIQNVTTSMSRVDVSNYYKEKK